MSNIQKKNTKGGNLEEQQYDIIGKEFHKT